MTVKVIRVIQYEGTVEDVRRVLSKSLPLGEKVLPGYTITVGEHLNQLPKQVKLSDKDVTEALEVKPNDQVS